MKNKQNFGLFVSSSEGLELQSYIKQQVFN